MTQTVSPKVQSYKPSVPAEVRALREQLKTQAEQIKELKQQLDWFKRQLFGNKSEKRLEIDMSHQADLLVDLGVTPPSLDDIPTEQISYKRRKKQRDAKTVNDTGLRFDASVASGNH